MNTMDRPAAIAGSFSDFKLVRTRSTAQLIIEIPIEAADEALRVLGGVPQSGKENPVAIARLKPGLGLVFDKAATTPLGNEPGQKLPELAQPPQAPEKPASGTNGDGADKHRLSRQAALCCQDARFKRFLEETSDYYHVTEDAAEYVRAVCKVKSRAEFDTDPVAIANWCELYGEYIAWLNAP